MLEALRFRDFRLLWTARLVSQLGSWLLVVAVPAHVLALTGSVAATGLTLAAQFLPPAVLGPAAGVLADRLDRRHLLIAADVLSATAIALLLFARSPGDLWLIYLALVAESVGTVVFRPAVQARTPAVVGIESALSSANALNGLVDGTVRLIGAPIGGLLYAWAGFAFLVGLDAGSYLLSAVLVAITVPANAARRYVPSGLTFLLSNRTVRVLLLVNVIFHGAKACLSALLIPYGMIVLGGSKQTGLLMSALGVGFLLGAPLVRMLSDRIPPGFALAGALTVTGVGYVLLFTARSLPSAWPAAALIGVAGSAALGIAQTTLQRATPNEMLGRTASAMVTAEAGATLAGALIGPALTQRLSISETAFLAGAAAIVSGVAAALLLPRTCTTPHDVPRPAPPERHATS
jgi:MFS family permease